MASECRAYVQRVKTNIFKDHGEEEVRRLYPAEADNESDMVPMHLVTSAVEQLIDGSGGFGRCLKILPYGVSDAH